VRVIVLDEAELEAVRGREGVAEQVDVILTLGGDGMMLVAARAWPGVPLLGINFGYLGFLTAVEQHDWQLAIERYLAGTQYYNLREESTLAVEVQCEGQVVHTGWAANDVVLRARDAKKLAAAKHAIEDMLQRVRGAQSSSA